VANWLDWLPAFCGLTSALKQILLVLLQHELWNYVAFSLCDSICPRRSCRYLELMLPCCLRETVMIFKKLSGQRNEKQFPAVWVCIALQLHLFNLTLADGYCHPSSSSLLLAAARYSFLLSRSVLFHPSLTQN